MYRFEWAALCDAAFRREVAAAAGLGEVDLPEGALALLERLLAAAGGLPVVARLPSNAEALALARDVLHDAVRHALAALRVPPAPAGHVLRPSGVKAIGAVATAVERVPVNSADAATLARATRVTPALAASIVAERRARGRFAGVEELDRRLRGVSARNRERIAGAVRFDGPSDALARRVTIAGDPARDLGTLVALQDGATPAARLEAALEAAVVACAAAPHPDTAAGRMRARPAPVDAVETAVEWTGVLFGDAYYEAMRALFARARRSIDVCMFHIALGNEAHPTTRLLEALVRARGRGVRVRVLVDRDRERDPYLSTIVNARARQYLRRARVPVRSDTPGRLLHSKFVVIDRTLAVVGSHNWSAGSYFDFDDLTLALQSPALAAQLTRRFGELWAAGE